MTRVDFYVLEGGSGVGHDRTAHDRMVCRVVEKAFRRGHSIFIHCNDDAQASTFDDLLWRFSDTSFVPHAIGETDVPVQLGCGISDSQHVDVLVNLSDTVPEAVSQFERVVESAGFDDSSRTRARDRYRYYQERGYPLNTHKVRG